MANDVETSSDLPQPQLSNGNRNGPSVSENDRKDPDDEFAKDYEQQLWNVRLVALAGNAVYSFNRFLCYCALTWSMAVILGAVLTSISKTDYYCVSTLLLLEAIRASVARLFRQIVLQQVIYGTTDPRLIVYDDKKKQKRLILIRTTEQLIQLSLVSVSLTLPAIRLNELAQSPVSPSGSTASRSAVPPPQSSASFSVVDISLRIFYYLVLINAFTFGLLFLKPLLLHGVLKSRTQSMSLMKYHDHIQWIGTELGFVRSCADVDFLSFAFRLQAEEYRSNHRAPVVMAQYRDMFQYLYSHPRFKGFEKARQVLESGDPFEREAAANIVGCWARMMKENNSSKLKTMMMQGSLLAELLDAAAEQTETGRAATSSFQALSEMDAAAVARVRNTKGQPIADFVMDMIHEAVTMGKPDKGVVYVKVWNHLLPKLMPVAHSAAGSGGDNPATLDLVNQYAEASAAANWPLLAVGGHVGPGDTRQNPNSLLTASKLRVLQEDLIRIVMHPKSLKRTQAVAAYALLQSGDPALSDGDDYTSIMAAVRERVAKEPNAEKGHAFTEHLLPEESDCIYYVVKRDVKLKDPVDQSWNPVESLKWPRDKIKVRPVQSKGGDKGKASEGAVFPGFISVAPAIFFLVVAVAALTVMVDGHMSGALSRLL